jgi:hypothetical protein
VRTFAWPGTAGLRYPDVAVPLGTYNGWSLRATGYADGDQFWNTGSFVPFASLMDPLGSGIGEIVTGRSPLSSLDAVLKDWRAGGGDQIRTEYQKAYEDARR